MNYEDMSSWSDDRLTRLIASGHPLAPSAAAELSNRQLLKANKKYERELKKLREQTEAAQATPSRNTDAELQDKVLEGRGGIDEERAWSELLKSRGLGMRPIVDIASDPVFDKAIKKMNSRKESK